MSDPLRSLSDDARERLKRRDPPRFVAPMLATLTHHHFSDPDWIFERKLDGVRCLAFRSDGDVRLLSRNEKAQNATYPEIVDALASQSEDVFVVDGEVVAFERGVTSFSRLQGRMQLRDEDEARASGIAVFYYVFDVLYLRGYDTTEVPQRERKALLRHALRFDSPIRFTPHRNADGEAYHDAACRKGWEGVIAKRADAPYVHSRSTDWLKFKCVNRQELVIGGYTEPGGSRRGFGALLVGYYEDDALRYAGRVGTGYDEDTLDRLAAELGALERETSPFEGPHAEDAERDGVHFVTPKLVAEVGFTEWTDDGRLRHPRYVGLREDKAADEVVREHGR